MASLSAAQGATLGEGLYPTGARFNHDCDPNCRISFDTYGCLCVHARRAIRRGEELCITYTNSALPGKVRREALRKTYLFDCTCATCAAELKGGGALQLALPCEGDRNLSGGRKKLKLSNS